MNAAPEKEEMDIDSTEQATATCSWSVNGLSVERVAVANLPTTFGEFKIAGYRSLER